MKKIFPLILVLLFMLISSVSAEEEIVNLAAVYHADGSITLIGSTTAKYWLVEDMVLVYKEGEDPEEDSPLFFYHISGGDTFSITHPAPYCWHTDRKDEFRDVERMILKPGRYFAIIKRGSLTEDTILSDPAYFCRLKLFHLPRFRHRRPRSPRRTRRPKNPHRMQRPSLPQKRPQYRFTPPRLRRKLLRALERSISLLMLS